MLTGVRPLWGRGLPAQEVISGMLAAFGAQVRVAESGHRRSHYWFAQRPEVLIADWYADGCLRPDEQGGRWIPTAGSSLPRSRSRFMSSPQDRLQALRRAIKITSPRRWRPRSCPL